MSYYDLTQTVISELKAGEMITCPSTYFIEKAIVSGGRPYTTMFGGGPQLWK